MTREELEHAIRAACDIAQDDAVYVFGSQAILGEFPDAPPALRQSMEVDVSPVTRLDRVDNIDGSLGQDSQFHRTFGFYVHGVPILEAAKLPDRWKNRPIRVCDDAATLGRTGLCLEAHDLAASKLAAFRDKDMDFVRVLLLERLISPRTLRARIRTLPVDEELRDRCLQWVKATAAGLPPRRRARRRKAG